MKSILFICIIALVLMGCYTENCVREADSISKGTVRFFLFDSTHITAKYYEHHFNEYKVVGILSTNNFEEKEFSGYIKETDIAVITVEKFDITSIAIPTIIFGLLFISL